MRNSRIVAACTAIALALSATGALAGTSAGRRAGPADVSSAPAPTQQTPDALTRALRADRLSGSEYALERARSLFHLESVREDYGHVARPGPRASRAAHPRFIGELEGRIARPRDSSGPSDGRCERPATRRYGPTPGQQHMSANFCFPG